MLEDVSDEPFCFIVLLTCLKLLHFFYLNFFIKSDKDRCTSVSAALRLGDYLACGWTICV